MHSAATALLAIGDYIFDQLQQMCGINALSRTGDRTLKEPGVTSSHREQSFDQVRMLQFRLHDLL
jgi:hypothetical protein